MLTEMSCSRPAMGWPCCQHTHSVHLERQVERKPVFTEAESCGDQAVLDQTLCFGDQTSSPLPWGQCASKWPKPRPSLARGPRCGFHAGSVDCMGQGC